MKYLIIGGLSVFGEALINRLLKKEDTESVLVTKSLYQVAYERDGLEWINCDFKDSKEIFEVLFRTKPQAIFHLKVQDSVGQSWRNPNEAVDINIIETINILNAVRELDYRPRLIIGGSGEEYGHLGFDHLPLKEDETPRPVNIFGATKACQTMFAKLYHRAYGIDVIVIRTFNETSPLQDERWAISSLCKQFVRIERGEQNHTIHVGNTNIIRDFTDVDDLVRAFELVAKTGKSGEVYNAARGSGMSVREIISCLEEITGIKVNIVTDKSKVRPIDTPSVIADVNKIKEDSGWKTEIDIKTTLEKMIEKWRATQSI